MLANMDSGQPEADSEAERILPRLLAEELVDEALLVTANEGKEIPPETTLTTTGVGGEDW